MLKSISHIIFIISHIIIKSYPRYKKRKYYNVILKFKQNTFEIEVIDFLKATNLNYIF